MKRVIKTTEPLTPYEKSDLTIRKTATGLDAKIARAGIAVTYLENDEDKRDQDTTAAAEKCLREFFGEIIE